MCLASFAASAMDWPSPGAELTANFGSDSGGLPDVGDSFAGVGAVRAAETGELLFASGSDASFRSASRLPSPLGAWAAVDHGDGLVSLYGRLSGNSASYAALPDIVQKGVVLGWAGVSGWTDREGFYFALFDRKERRWINPAMIADRRSDTMPPVIQAVRLRNARDRDIDPSQARIIPQGTYRVFVTVSDIADQGGAALAPFRIMGALNGQEVGVIALETLSARDGIFWMYRNGLVPARHVYAEAPAFELGEAIFTRGQTALEIIAQDANENVQSVVFNFTVE
jgi:murein DD-endopeptidase MepM/ murein hydrolase activator NlpD